MSSASTFFRSLVPVTKMKRQPGFYGIPRPVEKSDPSARLALHPHSFRLGTQDCGQVESCNGLLIVLIAALGRVFLELSNFDRGGNTSRTFWMNNSVCWNGK